MMVTLPTGALPLRDCSDSLVHEHAVLARQMGKAQARVSRQMWEQEARLQVMTRELIVLRAQLVCLRTAVLWGMGLPMALASPRHTRSDPVSTPHTSAYADAAQVICNTGCTGHAHHWLTDDGHCRLRDQACVRTEPQGRGRGR